MKKTLKELNPEIINKIPKYKEKVLNDIYNGNKYKNFDLKKLKKP